MTILFAKIFKKRHKKQQYKNINCVKFFVENISKSNINYGDVVIFGDMTVTGNMMLEKTAQVTGNITTGTIAVEKGAIIKGGIEIKA